MMNYFRISLDIRSYVDALCPSSRDQAQFDCFMAVGQDFTDVDDLSYLDTCTYSMLRENSQYYRVMTQALITDSLLIPAKGRVPLPPSIDQPVTPKELVLDTTLPLTTTQASALSTNQTQGTPETIETHQIGIISQAPPLNPIVLSQAPPLRGHVIVVMATALYLLCHFM